MERASKPELAQRINQAFSLMEKGLHSDQIIQQLQQEFGVSQIQAYRYLQRAKKNKASSPFLSRPNSIPLNWHIALFND